MTGRHGRHERSLSRPLMTTGAVLLVCVTAGLIVGMTRSDGARSVTSDPAPGPASMAPSASSALGLSNRSDVGRIPPIPGGPTGPAHTDHKPAAGMSPPARVAIPSIGVDSSLQPLSLQADKTLQSPTEWAEAGWYAGGVRPGDPGPAVIAGHVDSRNGPAVFFRLRDLHAGADVYITTQSGKTLHFVVDTSQRFPKDRFPTEAVYGPTPLPVLRLITCTGEFDAANHNYLDNLVVTAHLA
jgi:Sortase domain